jgi:hypothetical protein
VAAARRRSLDLLSKIIRKFLLTLIRAKKFSAAGLSWELEAADVKAIVNDQKNAVLDSPIPETEKLAKLSHIREEERQFLTELVDIEKRINELQWKQIRGGYSTLHFEGAELVFASKRTDVTRAGAKERDQEYRT